MKEIRLPEILVPICKTARGKIPENRNLHMNCCENLDSIYVIVHSLHPLLLLLQYPVQISTELPAILIQIGRAFYRNSI